MARARKTLTEARELHRLGFHNAAVSRAYYAAFYASLALLASVGLEAKTHDGVHALIAQHFVRAGRLPGGMNRLLKHLEGDRELADYDLANEMSAPDAASTIADAEQYLAAAESVLNAPG
jgi:uncharacterized protein (UPF0332 family)